jgi:hypothetical protein
MKDHKFSWLTDAAWLLHRITVTFIASNSLGNRPMTVHCMRDWSAAPVGIA